MTKIINLKQVVTRLLIAVACFASAMASSVHADTVVDTYAGSGGTGWNNGGFANGPRLSARFQLPIDVAWDSKGNMYVADGNNRVIRKITPAGVVSVYAGHVGVAQMVDGPAATASFYGPQVIVFDAADNLYVVDQGFAIRKVTPAGVVTTLAGGGGGYVNGTGTAAKFYSISGMAIDGAGNLFVADYFNHAIRKVTPAGVVTTYAGVAPGLQQGTGYGLVNGPAATARFNGPKDIAFDSAGNMYVSDWGNLVIRKITPAGMVSTFAGSGSAGGVDGPAATASFFGPHGLTFDTANNLYVVEFGISSRIRKITPAGTVSTLAGSINPSYVDGPGLTAKFNWPTDAITDLAGTLYVADYYNHRVRRITQDGGTLKICKVAGLGIAVGSLYNFTVSVPGWPSSTVKVPAGPAPGGYCAVGPKIAPGTTATITELLMPSVAVNAISAQPPARLVAANTGTGVALVAIGDGVTEVTFSNRIKITNPGGDKRMETGETAVPDTGEDRSSPGGYLEICKTGSATGNFAFNLSGNSKRAAVVVPSGACSPPMRLPPGQITITEVPQPNSELTGCSALPADRQIACDLVGRTSTVTVVQGDVSTQTIAVFNNTRKVKVVDTGGGPKK